MSRSLQWLLAGLFAVACVAFALSEVQLVVTADVADGTVVARVPHQSEDGTTYELHYAFTYEGREHRFVSPIQRGGPGVPVVGDRVRILVPPGEPERASPGGAGDLFLYVIVGLVAFVPLVIVASVSSEARLGELAAEGVVGADPAELARIQDLPGLQVQCRVVGSERVEGEWVVLVRGGGRVFTSTPVHMDLGALLDHRSVTVWVDPDDRERYAFDLGPMVAEIAAERAESTP
ncbi:MAG: hypothetical protein H6736_24915 [Alphaproteobacteria bacterium]|nr:hypothetical protein [Alphaproteobacteria bacterium]MCB9695059.1 hypothetical protein [Alphaproteobacteria bacterium]